MYRLALLIAACLFSTVAAAADVQVAVAANFAGPLQRIAEAFGAATGHRLVVSSGATGKFYTQIVSGAPFEVLLAADDETPARLVAEGHAVAGTAFTYAIGRLVLWSAQPGLVDAQGAVLASDAIRHIAIANPKVAPYGAAAMQVLRSRGLAQALAPRLVTAESIAQAFQFVATGNAEIGFVALSQAAAPGKPAAGSWWLVPQNLHDELEQGAVLLRAGAGNPAARSLLAFLKSDAALQLIREHGYGVPAP
ncbi:MAG: molybdate ABC transporter substrate-binding protein [Burkholderiaceae bacterium]